MTCSEDECGRPRYRKTLCQTHAKRGPGPIRTPIVQTGDCHHPHCDSPAVTVGMCRRHARLVSQYQLSFEKIEQLYADPRCGVCQTPDSGARDFHIDHDHACCPGGMTQKCGSCVRGLLCGSCNHGLGNFRDDVALLSAAIAYLQQGVSA